MVTPGVLYAHVTHSRGMFTSFAKWQQQLLLASGMHLPWDQRASIDLCAICSLGATCSLLVCCMLLARFYPAVLPGKVLGCHCA